MPGNLLGNTYSPSRAGSSDVKEYASWLKENRVDIWIRYDSRSEPLWAFVSATYPRLLTECDVKYGIGSYRVDPLEVARILR